MSSRRRVAGMAGRASIQHAVRLVVSFAAAEQFVLRGARLLERRRFEWRFRGGAADAVVEALRPYRNDDGGFGNALESDIRGPSSQPVPVEKAFELLDEVGRFDG